MDSRKRKVESPSQATTTQAKEIIDSSKLDDHSKKILEVRKLVRERDEAREGGQFVKSDNLRDKLSEMGVFVVDQKGGPSGWRFLDGSSKKLPAGLGLPASENITKTPKSNTTSPVNPKEKEVSNKKQKVTASASSKTSEEQSRNKATLNKLLGNNESGPTAQANGPKVSHVQGVKMTDLKIGTGPTAQSGQRASVMYAGRLLSNGKQFDASKKPFKFRLGAGEVIKGWDIGVVGMRVGGKRNLVIPPEKGYGRNGAPPTIPGNATLVFDVTLLEVK